jgi:hypothetical protein
MRKVHLIAPLILSLACSNPPVDRRREPKSIGSSAQVQAAILAIENKNDYSLAARHSWDLWEFLNANESASPSVSGSAADTPKWIRWCQANVGLYAKQEANSICRPSSDEDKFRSTSQKALKLVFHQKFRGDTALTDIGETVHLSPGFVASIRSLLDKDGKCLNSRVTSQTLLECAGQAMKAEELKAVLASGKLDPMSTIIKASWLHVAQPMNGEKFIEIKPWNGMSSLDHYDNLSNMLNGGIKVGDWSTTSTKLALPEFSSNTNFPCSGSVNSSQAPPFESFYHLQICDDQFTNQPQQWKKGDYLLLLGLHVMTNLSASGNWTWSTFYWHPDASKAAKEAYLLERSNNLNSHDVRPKLDGWRNNYRMDLQYSAKEEIPVDPMYIGQYPSKPINPECNVASPPKIPRAVFNPYIEGKQKCGGFSNCMGCHSHARVDGFAGSGLGNAKNRTILDPSADTSKEVYTHFVWSLVNPK